jgi:hypothetical protein
MVVTTFNIKTVVEENLTLLMDQHVHKASQERYLQFGDMYQLV